MHVNRYKVVCDFRGSILLKRELLSYTDDLDSAYRAGKANTGREHLVVHAPRESFCLGNTDAAARVWTSVKYSQSEDSGPVRPLPACVRERLLGGARSVLSDQPFP